MFTQLANYLLGTTSSNNQETSEVEETRNIRLTPFIASDGDEWLLVDRDSEGNSEISSVESLDDSCDDEVDDFDTPHAHTTILTRTSSTSSLPCNTMEESWYITPPPCFTSAGPIIVETSPLENLLIEHPSMSVYQHSQPIYIARRHNSAPLQPVNDLITNDIVQEPVQRKIERGEEEEEDEAEEEIQVVAAPHLQVPRRTSVELLQQQQFIKKKQAQKVQIQRACRSLKRGYLERTNKAREVNCRNQRQRRGERSQGARRSYANNNRKC